MIKLGVSRIVRNRYLLVLLALVVAAGFLRLFRFGQFVTFLGDQGRDAIVFKRIITLEHLPAIGAPSSIGQIYLGPFYYYFITPWLWLFNFNPIGPAFGVAVFSLLYIVANFIIVNGLLGKKTALISSLLITFSYIMIDYSRFSWNPNLLPFATLLAVYFFYKAIYGKERRFFMLVGFFLSVCIQLHYLALILFIPLTVLVLLELFRSREKKPLLTGLLLAAVVFAVVVSPLVIFDLRHNFLNIGNFFRLFRESGNIAGNKITGLFVAFNFLNRNVFARDLPFWLTTFFLALLLLSLPFIKRNRQINYFLLFFFASVFGVGMYSGPKSPHYFTVVYPIYFIILAYYLSLLKKSLNIVALLFMLSFVFLNSRYYTFLFEKGNNQISEAKRVAQKISENNRQKEYTLISLPERSSDDPYRYFLELWGKPPIDRNVQKRTNELFITCTQPCQTIGNPQWDVALFAPKRVDNKWQIGNVTIYKLSH